MITFLQQSQNHPDTFATVDDPSKATHFTNEEGKIRCIADLSKNDSDELTDNMPLGMPVMNFDNNEKEEIIDNGEPLDVPNTF